MIRLRDENVELSRKLFHSQQYAKNRAHHHYRTEKEKEQLVKLIAELKEKVQKLDLTAPYIRLQRPPHTPHTQQAR